MEVITSKITSKGKVTVPEKVREFPILNEGDSLACKVNEENAVIRRIPMVDFEWVDELDDEL